MPTDLTRWLIALGYLAAALLAIHASSRVASRNNHLMLLWVGSVSLLWSFWYGTLALSDPRPDTLPFELYTITSRLLHVPAIGLYITATRVRLTEDGAQ